MKSRKAKTLQPSLVSVRYLLIVILAAILATAGYDSCFAQAEKPRGLSKIEIGSAPFGGAFYAVGTSIAKVFQDEMKIPCTASTTEGGGENMRLIDRGEVQAALIPTISLYYGWTGRKPFEKEYRKARLIAYLYPSPSCFIALTKSGLKSVKDLKGKRVGAGVAPTTWDMVTKPQIEAHDLNYDQDIRKVYGGFEALATQLGDGIIDAMITDIVAGRMLIPAVKELAFSKPIYTLEYDRAAVDALVKSAPYFSVFDVPAGIAPGWDKRSYHTIDHSGPYLVVPEGLSDDAAYLMAKTIHKNLERLAKLSQELGYPLGNPSSLAFQQAKVIPFHPGAIRYWKEVGFWKE